MRNWMLGMTLVAGLLTTGAVAANAAPQVYQEGYAAGYVPPCPGDGYVWTAGYYNGPRWIPGAWNFRGRPGFDRRFGYGYGRGPVYGYGGVRFDHQRDFRYSGERGFDGGGDRNRGFDRGGDRNRGFDRGGERGGERGFAGRR
jgi:hypothetical protein